jgi:hypothetical protein
LALNVPVKAFLACSLPAASAALYCRTLLECASIKIRSMTHEDVDQRSTHRRHLSVGVVASRKDRDADIVVWYQREQ